MKMNNNRGGRIMIKTITKPNTGAGNPNFELRFKVKVK